MVIKLAYTEYCCISFVAHKNINIVLLKNVRKRTDQFCCPPFCPSFPDERLDYDIINISPHLLHVVAVVAQPPVDGRDASLAPGLVVTHKLRTVLIYRIVC